MVGAETNLVHKKYALTGMDDLASSSRTKLVSSSPISEHEMVSFHSRAGIELTDEEMHLSM